MEIVSSYKIKIKDYNHIFKETISIYRQALSYIIAVVEKEWLKIKPLNGKMRNSAIEALIHGTTKNPFPVYPFDTLYYKMPSYLRRNIIQEAIGIVSAYHTQLDLWKKAGNKGNPPKLQVIHSKMPTFYRDNMYLKTGVTSAKIKVYHNNDWVWLPIELNKSDVTYIEKHCAGAKESAPVLEKHGKCWYLRFAYKKSVPLNKIPMKKQTIIAVDLGLNNNAVCSAMDVNGTVLARKFINLTREKDSLRHKLNKLKKIQRMTPPGMRKPALWARINGLNTHMSNMTAKLILQFALDQHANVVVFEYLDIKVKKTGLYAQRLSLWQKQLIQDRVERHAHLHGIRISRVNAANSSRLAYDGSGPAVRNKNNHSLCVFISGKQYNSDLSASYNIGARYFIRELIKPLPETARLALEAKVPSAAKRSTCTLATLISLNAESAA